MLQDPASLRNKRPRFYLIADGVDVIKERFMPVGLESQRVRKSERKAKMK